MRNSDNSANRTANQLVNNSLGGWTNGQPVTKSVRRRIMAALRASCMVLGIKRDNRGLGLLAFGGRPSVGLTLGVATSAALTAFVPIVPVYAQNVYVGSTAPGTATNGTSIGGGAGQNVTGSSNTASGVSAGINVVGNGNNATGVQSGISVTGDNNIASGRFTGRSYPWRRETVLPLCQFPLWLWAATPPQPFSQYLRL